MSAPGRHVLWELPAKERAAATALDEAEGQVRAQVGALAAAEGRFARFVAEQAGEARVRSLADILAERGHQGELLAFVHGAAGAEGGGGADDLLAALRPEPEQELVVETWMAERCLARTWRTLTAEHTVWGAGDEARGGLHLRHLALLDQRAALRASTAALILKLATDLSERAGLPATAALPAAASYVQAALDGVGGRP